MIVDKQEEVLLPAAALDKAGNQMLAAGGSQVGLGSWLPVGRKRNRHPLVCRQLSGRRDSSVQLGTVAAQVELHKVPTRLADRLEDTQELPCHTDTSGISTSRFGRTLEQGLITLINYKNLIKGSASPTYAMTNVTEVSARTRARAVDRY